MAVSFKGAHFPAEIILIGERWYVANMIRLTYMLRRLPIPDGRLTVGIDGGVPPQNETLSIDFDESRERLH